MSINWPSLFAKPKLVYAQTAWPIMVAHAILAAESTIHSAGIPLRSPIGNLDDGLKHPSNYMDAANAFIDYYHQEGKFYAQLNQGNGIEYEGLDEGYRDIFNRSRLGQYVTVTAARNLMFKIANQLIESKLIQPAFAKSLVLAWRSGDYATILKALPDDADIKPSFSKLIKTQDVAAANAPAETSSNANALDGYLEETYPDDYHLFDPIPLPKTAGSAESLKLFGTPIITGTTLYGAKSGVPITFKRAYTVSTLTDGDDVVSLDTPHIMVIVDVDGELQDFPDDEKSDDPNLDGVVQRIVEGRWVQVKKTDAIIPVPPTVAPTKDEFNKPLNPTEPVSAVDPLAVPPENFKPATYKIDAGTSAYLQDNKLEAIEAPSSASYFPGAVLKNAEGETVKVRAFATTESGEVRAIIYLPDADSNWLKDVPVWDLVNVYSPAYEKSSSGSFEALDNGTGFNIPKGAAAGKLGYADASHQITPSALTLVAQPLLTGSYYNPGNNATTYTNVSAGLICFMQNPTVFNEAKEATALSGIHIVLVRPYGGQHSQPDEPLAVPIGPVAPGESVTHAAVREFHEWTDMFVQPAAWLADYEERSKNDVLIGVKRIYVGLYLGGQPNASTPGAPNPYTGQPLKVKSSAIVLASLKEMNESPWFKQLSPLDQKIVLAAHDWFVANGMPSSADGSGIFKPKEAPAGLIGSVSGYGSGQSFPAALSGGNSSVPLDYMIPAWLPNAVFPLCQKLEKRNKFELTSWSFDQAKTYVQDGYPEPGSYVNIKGESTNYFVYGYAHIDGKPVGGFVISSVTYRTIVLCSLETDTVKIMVIKQFNNEVMEFKIPAAEFKKTIALQLQPASAPLTSVLNILNQFKKTAPYLVSSPMLKALADYVNKNLNVLISIQGTMTSDPAALPANTFPLGTYVKFENILYTLLGYVVVRLNYGAKGTTYYRALAGTIEGGQLECHILPAAELEVSEGSTGVISLKHPDTAINALMAAAADTTDALTFLSSFGYNFGAALQIIADSTPTLPNLKKLLPNQLTSICAAYKPGGLTASMWHNTLKALELNADEKTAVEKQAAELAGPVSKKAKPEFNGLQNPPAPAQPAVSVPKPAPTPLATAPSTFNYQAAYTKLHALTENDVKEVKDFLQGGSNPRKVLVDSLGTKYMLKGAKDNSPLRLLADETASVVYSLLSPETIPVRRFKYKGFDGAMQPILPGMILAHEKLEDYKASQVVDILRQHVFDCFTGNGDAKYDNWLIAPDGRMVAIDQAQALRFIAKGEPDFPIDTFVKYGGNIGGLPLGKQLLSAWARKKIEIPAAAFKAMRQSLIRIEKLANDTLIAATSDLFLAVSKDDKAFAKSLGERLLKWKAGYTEAWDVEMQKLASMRGEKFSWPYVPGGAGAQEPEAIIDFDLDKIKPSNMGMTKETHQLMEEVVKAGWKGKSMRADKGYVENQEVFIKTCQWHNGGAATLLSWRLSYEGQMKAAKVLSQFTQTIVPLQGPQALPFDSHVVDTTGAVGNLRRYFTSLRRASGHFNSHVFGNKNGSDPKGQPDVVGLHAVVDTFIPELVDLREQAQSSKQKNITVAVNGTPYSVAPSAILGMVNQYLPSAEELAAGLKDWETNGVNGVYYKKIKLTDVQPFTWVPSEEKTKKPEAAGFTVSSQAEGYQPNTSVVEGSKTILLYPGGLKQYKGTFQYTLTGTGGTTCVIHFNPAHNPAGVKQGTATHWGQCWAYIVGEPNPTTVAKVLALFEKATQTNMKMPTEIDNEVNYWAKQAYCAIPDYIQPTDVGLATSVPVLGEAMALYNNGKAEEARDTLRAYVAKQTGISVDALTKAANNNGSIYGDYEVTPTVRKGPDGVLIRDAKGQPVVEPEASGRIRYTRLGYDRNSVLKLMGDDVCVAHNAGVSMLAFMQRALKKNGALISKAEFANYGIPWTGDTSIANAGSAPTDFAVGGSTNLFLGIRSAKHVRSKMLYFDPSLLLRTDVIVVKPGGDGFGDPTFRRAASLNAIRKAVKETQGPSYPTTSDLGNGEHSQICARHTIMLSEYLVYAGCVDEKERAACIALCHLTGFEYFNAGGLLRPPEEVFVVAGKTSGLPTVGVPKKNKTKKAATP